LDFFATLPRPSVTALLLAPTDEQSFSYSELISGDRMKRNLDLAIVLAHFGTGGVERVACILANRLGLHGIRTGFAVVTDDGATRGVVDPSVPVHELLGRSWFSRFRALKLILSIPAMAWFIRKNKPAVLMSPGNHTHVPAALAHFLSMRQSTHIVIKLTNPILREGASRLNTFVRRMFYRWLFRRASLIHVLSPDGIRKVADIAPSATLKVRFVHNPYVSTQGVQPDAPFTPSGEGPLVLSVGRLTAQKNYEMLLEAMASIEGRAWRLVILGEGPQQAALEARAKALGIASRVRFPGFVDDPAPYYREAHVFALSSVFEDLPAVVLEAMSHGCKVITTRCSPALESIMNEAAGTLVPIDRDALAEAIGRSLDAPRTRAVPSCIAKYTMEGGVLEHAASLAPLMMDADPFALTASFEEPSMGRL
jgi:glycosyltransferase involved in cell wall biosynthesis